MAMYPLASLVNHACAPNARVQYDGRQLQLVSASPMRPSAEVTISYGPTAGRTPLATRRAQLQEQYHFICHCPACEDEEPFDVDDNTIPDAAFDAALLMLDDGKIKEAIEALSQCCTHHMSLLAAHDGDGDERRAAVVAQRAAEAFDALGRAHCQAAPNPDYSAAADAIEQALELLRRSTAVSPGAEPSLAREEHKLATLRFHAAVQAGPGSRGEAAVAAAAKAARRALLSVKAALGDSDPATAELTHMVAALAGPERQYQEKQQQKKVKEKKQKEKDKKQKKKQKERNQTQPSDTRASPAADSGSDKAKSPTSKPAAAKDDAPTPSAPQPAPQPAPSAKKETAVAATTATAAAAVAAASPAEKVARCVDVLRTSSAVDERLAMATQLYAMLAPDTDTPAGDDDDGHQGAALLQRAFLDAGGAEMLHARLASMDDGWMAEAKNGSMDLYDSLARLDFVKARFVQVAQTEEQKLNEKLHEHEKASAAGSLVRPKPTAAAKTKRKKMQAKAATGRRRPVTAAVIPPAIAAAGGAAAATPDGASLELFGSSVTDLKEGSGGGGGGGGGGEVLDLDGLSRKLEGLGGDDASEQALDSAAVLLSAEVARTAAAAKAKASR